MVWLCAWWEQKYGFKLLPRNPSSFTPSLVDGPLQGKYLLLGDDSAKNHASIAQVSAPVPCVAVTNAAWPP